MGVHKIDELAPSALTYDEASRFFDELKTALGENPSRARDLARRWRRFLGSSETVPWGHRIHGVLLRLEGRWLASANAFLRAGETAPRAEDRMTFVVGAIDSFGRAGRVKQATQLAKRLAQSLERAGKAEKAALARLNAANALLWHDQYVPARKLFQEALAVLATENRVMAGSAWLGLSTCELYGGHPVQAAEAARTAARTFEELDLSEYGLIAKGNLAQAALLTGRADEAVDILLELKKQDRGGGQEEARLDEFLGDAYLQLNLLDEAAEAYRESLVRAKGLNRANVLLGLGRAALMQENFEVAVTELKRAVRAFRRFGNRVWQIAAQVELACALRQSGRASVAYKAVLEAVEQLKKLKSPYFRALALLELAECQAGVCKECSATVRRVESLLRSQGYLHLEWRTHAIRGSVSQRNALAHYRRMLEKILSARALTSSFVSRSAFLYDKREAMGRYVSLLLSSPTSKNVQEALETVKVSRSTALLDEVLSAHASASPELHESMEALRSEIHAALASEAQGSSRLAGGVHVSLATLQRKWVELTRHARASALEMPLSADPPDVVLVEAGRHLFSISACKSRRLDKSASDLQALSKRLRFELLAPMVDKHAGDSLLREQLSELAKLLAIKRNGRQTATVSPEGSLWQVPWSLLSALSDGPEIVLVPGGWSGRCDLPAQNIKRPMLWYQEHADLPQIKNEAEVFMQVYPGAQVCRSAEEVRECLANGDVDLLHVATHARFRPSNPQFSSLSFKDGEITAAEIARSQIRPALVALSACESGMMSWQNRAEPEGLARAFLARGARTVVGSTWPLDDHAAALFAYNFYHTLSTGVSVAAAVRTARCAVRAELPHPYYWGSFTLFGGYVS